MDHDAWKLGCLAASTVRLLGYGPAIAPSSVFASVVDSWPGGNCEPAALGPSEDDLLDQALEDLYEALRAREREIVITVGDLELGRGTVRFFDTDPGELPRSSDHDQTGIAADRGPADDPPDIVGWPSGRFPSAPSEDEVVTPPDFSSWLHPDHGLFPAAKPAEAKSEREAARQRLVARLTSQIPGSRQVEPGLPIRDAIPAGSVAGLEASKGPAIATHPLASSLLVQDAVGNVQGQSLADENWSSGSDTTYVTLAGGSSEKNLGTNPLPQMEIVATEGQDAALPPPFLNPLPLQSPLISSATASPPPPPPQLPSAAQSVPPNSSSGFLTALKDFFGFGTDNPPANTTSFSDVAKVYSDTEGQTGDPEVASQRAAILAKGIEAARQRAHQLFEDTVHKKGPVAQIRARYATQAGIPLDKIDENPFSGVTQQQFEYAYRSWAVSDGKGTPPWVRLAVAVKEGWHTDGSKPSEPSSLQGVSTESAARTLWRSLFYYDYLGTDHFIDRNKQKVGDNRPSFLESDAPAHQRDFESNANALDPGIAAKIDGELKVSPNPAGGFDVRPTGDFYVLSLKLVDSYFRENVSKVEGEDLGLGYIHWNMGDERYALFENSAINHGNEVPTKQPDGTNLSEAYWSFKTPIIDGEYDQPRRNALRFQYFSEVFRISYEGGEQ